MPNEDYEKKLTGILIHGFAITHAATAALLSQTMLGDEAALTFLTTQMIRCIARINGRSWNIGEAIGTLGILIGGYLGTRGAMFLVKWIPGIGNAANALTTFSVTELLGWITYLLVRENKNFNDLSKSGKINIIKKALNLLGKFGDPSKRSFESMSPQDKAEYESIMEQLKIKDLPEDNIQSLVSRLNEIMKKYIN